MYKTCVRQVLQFPVHGDYNNNTTTQEAALAFLPLTARPVWAEPVLCGRTHNKSSVIPGAYAAKERVTPVPFKSRLVT